MHTSASTQRPPSKDEQRVAMESYSTLLHALDELRSPHPEIEIEETRERIKIPLSALRLLASILKDMGEGRIISVVPLAAEMTTQAAAEIIGCSRPHLVKLLEDGAIPYTKVGKHRRIRFEDVAAYKSTMKVEREQLLSQMMSADEDAGLYDSDI